MLIELKVIVDVYDPPKEENGPLRLVRKGVIYRKTFNTEATTVEEYINDRGRILKSYSNVMTNGQSFKVKCSYKQVYELLKPIKVRGLVSYGKKNYKN